MGYEAASSVASKDEAVSPSAIEMVLKKSVEVEPLLDTDIFVSSIKKNESSSPESDSFSDNPSTSKSNALPPSHSADEPKSRPVPSIAKPVTPITKSTPAMNPSSFVYDVLLWKQIPRSAFYFILGGLALELIYRLASSLTLLSAVSYLLLGSLAINFSRTLISGKLIVSPWSSSSCLGASLRFLTAVINSVASTHDSYLNGQDALVTSKAALFLWAASLVTRQFSILTLLRIAHLAVFSLPLTYVTKKKQINVAFESALAQGKKHYVTINPRVKLGAFSFVFLVLVCFLPVLDKAAVSLIFLSFLAHVSKTSDIAGFRRRMVPVARVVNSAYDNIFKICATAVNKYEILPVPIQVDVRKKIQ